MDKLPPEIVDKIISYTDLNIAIITKNIYNINRFYNKMNGIDCISYAITHGNLETVKLFYDNYIRFKEYFISWAALSGHLEIIKLLNGYIIKVVVLIEMQ